MEGRVQEHRVLLVGVAYKSGSLVSISVSSRFSGDTGVEYRLLTLPCRFRFRPRILCLLSFPSVPVENKRNEQEDKNEGARDRGGASVVRRMTASPNRPVRCIPPPLFYPRSIRSSIALSSAAFICRAETRDAEFLKFSISLDLSTSRITC